MKISAGNFVFAIIAKQISKLGLTKPSPLAQSVMCNPTFAGCILGY